MTTTLRKIRRTFRTHISTQPAVYLPLMRRGPKGDRVFTADTELVIEGYPRSGNSFSEAAFLYAQGREVKLGHHTHASAHVIAAAQAGVPCLVVIRQPMGAARSLVQMEPALFDPDFALWEYITFYRALAPVRDKIVLATFDTVTRDFGKVITALNAKFGTDFKPFGHTPENEAGAFALLDATSKARDGARQSTEAYSPHADAGRRAKRDEEKRRFLEMFAAPELAARKAEAEALYEQLAATADA
ncbi:hypothetical protein [Roseivivax sediminis]|uniref:Sulfotransferase family protein n=1 Tax=Roseivivax sediminis TaxID=936889 RepID=A0A1I2CVE1_9RHOB|nr:hypothetical protein [Roseivivax sediminis]SFE72152.1 hypothetical protein SAMN04515678_11497 [Roseivivax sediminis]